MNAAEAAGAAGLSRRALFCYLAEARRVAEARLGGGGQLGALRLDGEPVDAAQEAR